MEKYLEQKQNKQTKLKYEKSSNKKISIFATYEQILFLFMIDIVKNEKCGL